MDKFKGPNGPKKELPEHEPSVGHATATKEGVGWKVEFDEAFLRELEDMPEDERKEIMDLVEGLKNGTVDPMTMGVRHCGYCGEALDDDTPDDINMCDECSNDLK